MGHKKDKKAPKIHIELDNPYRSYLAGQIVSGRLVIRNKKAKKVKGVSILLEGKGRVEWSENVRFVTQKVNGETRVHYINGGRTESVFSAKEDYITQKIQLAGDGETLITLPEGTIAYPFQFILPSNLPSSFTSKTGLVSYLLEAEVKRPTLKPNSRTCLPFTVNGILDLNLEAGARVTRQVSKAKGANCFSCRSGEIGFVLSLHRRSGYVPGEALSFRVEVTNGSNKKVSGVKASLQQLTTYHAEGRIRPEKNTIYEMKGPDVDRGEDEMWAPENFLIPSVPPTRLGAGCKIIDVQYYLCFEMKAGVGSEELTGHLPVIIGTIPFRHMFAEFRPPRPPPPMQRMPDAVQNLPEDKVEPMPSTSTQDALPSHKKSADLPPTEPFFADYPDLPPPSYAEAVASDGWSYKMGQPDTNGNSSPSSPSAPPLEEYVPNYIRYSRNN